MSAQRVEVVVRDFTQPVSDDAEAMRQWCELIRLALPDPHLYPHLYRATMTKRGWSMKKSKLKALAREAEVARAAAERKASTSAAEVRKLTAELEVIRKNWRPVPTTHPWQPRDPQCALCDDTRDSPRHATLERGEGAAVFLVRYERSRDNSDTIAVMASTDEAEALAERLYPQAAGAWDVSHLEPWKLVAKVSTLDDVVIERWTIGVPREGSHGDECGDLTG